MVKRAAVSAFLLMLWAVPAEARERIYGWCSTGGITLTVGGVGKITQPVQGSWPQCQITVYLSGITTIGFSGLSRSGGVVTATLTGGPNYPSYGINAQVIVQGVSDASFNGTFTVATVADATHITWAQVGANATTSGGNGTFFPQLYQDNAVPSTVQTNPFQASSPKGYFSLYALGGRYDVRMSAGTPAPGISPPFTLGDILICDPYGPNPDAACVGGGGGQNAVTVYHNDVTVGTEPGIDFRDMLDAGGGTNVSIQPATDDAANERVHLTFNSVQQYQNNATPVGAEPILNLIPGVNISLNPFVDNPGSTRVDTTINSVQQYQNNGSAVGAEPILNLIPGTNVTLNPFTDSGGKVNVTINSTAGGNICAGSDSCTTTDTEIIYTLHATTCTTFPYQPDSEFHESFDNRSLCPGFFVTLGSPLFIPATNWYGWSQSEPPGYQTATRIDMSYTWEDACTPNPAGCNILDHGYSNITGSLPTAQGGAGVWGIVFTGGGAGHPLTTSTSTIWTGLGDPPALSLIRGYGAIADTALTSYVQMTMTIHDLYLTIHEPINGLMCSVGPCNWLPGGSASIVVENNGTPVGSRPIINLLGGDATDDANNSRVDIGMQAPVVAFADLPTCNAGARGKIRGVTNSDTNVWGDTVVHTTGTTFVVAVCNGASWTVMGK